MRTDLRKGDMAFLGRLIHGPLELGAIPEETVVKLVDRGLAVQVLGCCEITASGQLSYHRQLFPRARRASGFSATPNDPLYSQALSHSAQARNARLESVLAMRRRFDAHIRQASAFPHWLMRMASLTAGQFRSRNAKQASQKNGHAQIDGKTD